MNVVGKEYPFSVDERDIEQLQFINVELVEKTLRRIASKSDNSFAEIVSVKRDQYVDAKVISFAIIMQHLLWEEEEKVNDQVDL